VIPEFVMQGIPGEHFDDVLAGITLGWLNLNSCLALKANCGAGVALITTFRFNAYGHDPYATHLLDSMLRYLRHVEATPGLALASVAQQHVR
jgi:hypothetical protein